MKKYTLYSVLLGISLLQSTEHYQPLISIVQNSSEEEFERVLQQVKINCGYVEGSNTQPLTTEEISLHKKKFFPLYPRESIKCSDDAPHRKIIKKRKRKKFSFDTFNKQFDEDNKKRKQIARNIEQKNIEKEYKKKFQDCLNKHDFEKAEKIIVRIKNNVPLLAYDFNKKKEASYLNSITYLFRELNLEVDNLEQSTKTKKDKEAVEKIKVYIKRIEKGNPIGEHEQKIVKIIPTLKSRLLEIDKTFQPDDLDSESTEESQTSQELTVAQDKLELIIEHLLYNSKK